MPNDLNLQADWVGLDREEYEERCNPYSHWEEQADWELDEADRKWKELQEDDE